MAVGIALGAATLVVTNEMTRNDSQPGNTLTAARTPSSPAAVEKAYEAYQKAYKEYQQAVGLGREDMQKYGAALQKAKRNLEIEILRNTPGVSEMDLNKLEEGGVNETTQSSAGSGDAANPFKVSTVFVGDSSDSMATSRVSVADRADSPAPVSSADGISDISYYRVQSGDTLSQICEKFYGDSGMWQHILKYQANSVAATPNLIFPGQLIALPKGLKTFGQKFKTKTAEIKDKVVDLKDRAIDLIQKTKGGSSSVGGGESWQNRFQKDYLISDSTLTDSSTMTVAQIQKFLESRKSVLAKPYRGSSPAKMIYDAAKKYGINPQVLLTRLQCEQGLISKKTATQKQLDWALGVGCYDSGNWNQKFKGFDKQIEYAAQTYRRHYDAAKARLDRGEKITMNIDGQQVTVKNAATYSFYKYCPHFQGNKLFYDVWRGYRSKF
jgi:nucleoid-associated protein YgaU